MDVLLKRYIELVHSILQAKSDRKEKVSEFQDLIWEKASDIPDKAAREVLFDLAYDLSYYEPDEKLLREDPRYYGDDKLEQELLASLKKLA